MDIIEHYLKGESLIEIPTNFKRLITEDEEKASKVENAICMAYNIEHHGWTNETGPKKATADKWDWLDPKWEGEIRAGMGVVANGFPTSVTGPLVQFGSGGGGSSAYKTGDNTTPKTDIYGKGKDQNISLKKSAAQLASSKSGETMGIMDAALKHTEERGESISDNIKSVIDNIVGKKMAASQDSKLFVQIGASKDAFKAWYITKNNKVRWGEVKSEAKKLGIKATDAQISDHLKKELALVGATKKPKEGSESVGIISNDKGVVGVPGSRFVKTLINAWIIQKNRMKAAKTGADEIGVIVSKTHLDKRRRVDGEEVTNAMLTREKLTEKIRWVIKSSMDHSVWETKLNAELKKNDFLQTAIIYEAASGEYKFTGHVKKDEASFTGNRAVANRMMKFSDNGLSSTCDSYDDMWDWCVAHKKLAEQINISFKGSGTDYYAKMGLRTILQKESIHSQFESRLKLDDIINEEYSTLEENMNSLYLSEGVVDWIKGTTNKIKTLVGDFFKRVTTAVVTKLKEWADAGLEKFAELIGWEMTANCKIGRMP